MLGTVINSITMSLDGQFMLTNFRGGDSSNLKLQQLLVRNIKLFLDEPGVGKCVETFQGKFQTETGLKGNIVKVSGLTETFFNTLTSLIIIQIMNGMGFWCTNLITVIKCIHK